jgi:hypothetical protein
LLLPLIFWGRAFVRFERYTNKCHLFVPVNHWILQAELVRVQAEVSVLDWAFASASALEERSALVSVPWTVKKMVHRLELQLDL